MSEDWSSKREISFKKHSHRGIFPTSKVVENFVQFESSLERDFFLLLDHDPSVVIFQHQPHKIKFSDENNKTKYYTPDAKVKFKGKSKNVIAEIKREDDFIENQIKYLPKFQAATTFANNNSMEFVKISDKLIRTPRLYNVWFTRGSSRETNNEKYYDDLVSLLTPSIPVGFNELVIRLGQKTGTSLGKASQILCYFIYHGDVYIPTFSTERLSAETEIYLKEVSGSVFASLYNELILDDLSTHSGITNQDNQVEAVEEEITHLWGIDPKYEKLVQMKIKLINEWQAKFKKSSKSTENRKKKFLKKWIKIWKSEFDTGFSLRTLKRWIKKYREDGIDGLVPNYNRSGRKRDYSKLAYEIFEKWRVHYIRNRARTTVEHTHYEYQKDCEEQNLQGYEIFPFHTFKTYIFRNSSQADLDFGKLSRSKYDTRYDPSYSFYPNAIMPMQIIEMDNSQFDQFLVDQEFRDVIHPPWLTAAIDVYTMMISGYYLSLDHPSSTSVIETLIQSIMPKDEICKSNDIDDGQWRIEGFPVMLLVDNGRDYTANALVEFALENNVIIEYARLGMGKDKPHIEQWFRRVWDAVKNEGAGGYRPPFIDRILNRDYDPESEAVFTLIELEQWFLSWMLETYHESPRMKNMKAAPRVKLSRAYSNNGGIIFPVPQEPPNLSTEIGQWKFTEMKKHVMIRKEYKITNNGIRRLYLEYNSPELQSLYRHIGKDGKKAEVFIDRRDIRQIWVKHPKLSSYIRVPIYGEWYLEMQSIPALQNKPISDNQWKSIRKIITTANLKASDPDRLREAYHKRQKLITKAKDGVKSAKKKVKGIRTQREKTRQTEEKFSEPLPAVEGDDNPTKLENPNVEIPMIKQVEQIEEVEIEEDEDGVVLPTISKKLVKGER